MHSASKSAYVSHPTKQVKQKIGDVNAELFMDCRPTAVSSSRGAVRINNGASLAYCKFQLSHRADSKLVCFVEGVVEGIEWVFFQC